MIVVGITHTPTTGGSVVTLAAAATYVRNPFGARAVTGFRDRAYADAVAAHERSGDFPDRELVDVSTTVAFGPLFVTVDLTGKLKRPPEPPVSWKVRPGAAVRETPGPIRVPRDSRLDDSGAPFQHLLGKRVHQRGNPAAIGTVIGLEVTVSTCRASVRPDVSPSTTDGLTAFEFPAEQAVVLEDQGFVPGSPVWYVGPTEVGLRKAVVSSVRWSKAGPLDAAGRQIVYIRRPDQEDADSVAVLAEHLRWDTIPRDLPHGIDLQMPRKVPTPGASA